MVRVAVGILRKDGKILACQRKKGGTYAMKWEFPGGKVEPGESFIHCLQRELAEELSIRISTVGHVEVQQSHYDDGGVFEVAYCLVTEFEGEPQNNVFADIQWVTPQDLARLDILEGNRGIVGKLVQGAIP